MNIGNRGKNENRFRKRAKPKDFKKVLKRVIDYLKEDKKIIRLIFLFVIIDSVLVISLPYLIGKIVDIIENNMLSSVFLTTIIILMSCYFAEFIINICKGVLTARLSQRVVKKMRSSLFLKLQNLPMAFFQKSSRGDIMSRFTNDVDNISSGISSAVVQLMTDILNICLTFIMMLILSKVLTMLSIILAPMVILLSKFIASHTRKLFKEQQVELGKLNSKVEEIISDMNIVKAFNYEEKAIEDFKNSNKRLFTLSLKAQTYTGLLYPLMNVITNIGFAIICIAGGILASKDIITVGVIASFLSYSKQFTRPLNEVANLFNTFQSALAGCERIFEIIDEEQEEDEGSIPIKQSSLNNIEFKSVNFSYDNKNNVLKDINLKIKPGTSNAIIGETGSGKTTIVNLITRLYDIKEGTINLNNENLQNYSKDTIRSYLGVVPQEIYLFNGTIMENIRYGKLNCSDDEVIEASKIASAHKFITKLSKGYNTVLSEQGEGLSEGQKQLISISRTILKNPNTLILDEATSNIDTSTERKIQKAIKTIMEDRTSIIIAHRLSTIYNCDNIIVLKDGEIVEVGSHQELMSKRGIYYNNILLTKGGE